MSEVRQTSAMQIISKALADGNCATLLDVGCGTGGLKPHMEKLGVRWTGVDPAITSPVPGAHAAGAEALPFETGTFDAVLFLNSLHHVPIDQMAQALDEALRVLAPGRGPIIVIEPAVEGDLSEMLRHVDDEAIVRTAAQTALKKLLQEGRAKETDAYDYIRNERYSGFDDFVSRIAAADDSRIEALTRNRELLTQDFRRLSAQDDRGYVLRQSMRVRLLTHP
ncbi:class I SAM-dependent methyltransferase [Pontivivens nitratireducens]|uniref:class I SAM-dependent methyltransferase n=1 Tax=Pontivivens nitratireducens TaxID=2758038 RepID=UPI00163975EC|nr:class I SAM-dependent methyltransferase [Pontibrevibacter nitratireducens]